jgi:hypothetical protein
LRIISVALLLGFVIYRRGIIPLPNDGNWKNYYSKEDFSDATVVDLLREARRGHPYKAKPEFHAVSQQIASRGKSALPYLVELAGERTIVLLPGMYFLAKDHPYLPHVQSHQSEPRAIPPTGTHLVERSVV